MCDHKNPVMTAQLVRSDDPPPYTFYVEIIGPRCEDCGTIFKIGKPQLTPDKTSLTCPLVPQAQKQMAA